MNAPHPVNKLRAAMVGMAGTPEPAPVVALPASPSTANTARTSPRSQSRIGKRNVSAYVNPVAAKQLRLLGAEHDRSTQALVEEALNDLFRKYGKSAIA